MINYNKFQERLKALRSFRELSSDFIISGGICDLLYLNTNLNENQDIGLHIFNKKLLEDAKSMFDLFHFHTNDVVEIYASKIDILVLYFYHRNNINDIPIIIYDFDGVEYKLFSKPMRRNELDLKLYTKYSQPAINNVDVSDILKVLVLYNNQK